MSHIIRWLRWPLAGRALAVEGAGLTLVTAGLYQMYEPAAFVFAGAAVVFIAQGMERDE
jgi:hypothetical protein